MKQSKYATVTSYLVVQLVSGQSIRQGAHYAFNFLVTAKAVGNTIRHALLHRVLYNSYRRARKITHSLTAYSCCRNLSHL